MTDAASAALKGERAIAAALGMHHGSQDKCGVHRTSNMQQKTNVLFQGLISMLIAMALTLGEGATMGLFREDALFVFRRDFRFRRGHVSFAHRAKINSLVAVFAGGMEKVDMLRAAIIKSLATSDIDMPLMEHV